MKYVVALRAATSASASFSEAAVDFNAGAFYAALPLP
jgi:hypothetical protein